MKSYEVNENAWQKKKKKPHDVLLAWMPMVEKPKSPNCQKT